MRARVRARGEGEKEDEGTDAGGGDEELILNELNALAWYNDLDTDIDAGMTFPEKGRGHFNFGDEFFGRKIHGSKQRRRSILRSPCYAQGRKSAVPPN